MILIADLIQGFSDYFPAQKNCQPWEITRDLPVIINRIVLQLGDDYAITDGIAIHKTATIEQGVVLKAPAIIGEHCFIGAHAYLRGGVFLGKAVKIGTGCEIKSSVILDESAVAHFNFIGNSIIGNTVNFEAGSITANHFNERKDKNIFIVYRSAIINTGSIKFGSLVGDNSKVGANAVLSPGTILEPGSIVKRLELVDQQPYP
jgi:NDP-sugar pyrophosphorylase family protein